jgi:hypothetical protein
MTMPQQHDHGASSAQGDHPAVHGMLMVGETQVLMSRLPMFHSPHDYQNAAGDHFVSARVGSVQDLSR